MKRTIKRLFKHDFGKENRAWEGKSEEISDEMWWNNGMKKAGTAKITAVPASVL